jgi:hypothetical protein
MAVRRTACVSGRHGYRLDDLLAVSLRAKHAIKFTVAVLLLRPLQMTTASSICRCSWIGSMSSHVCIESNLATDFTQQPRAQRVLVLLGNEARKFNNNRGHVIVNALQRRSGVITDDVQGVQKGWSTRRRDGINHRSSLGFKFGKLCVIEVARSFCELCKCFHGTRVSVGVTSVIN